MFRLKQKKSFLMRISKNCSAEFGDYYNAFDQNEWCMNNSILNGALIQDLSVMITLYSALITTPLDHRHTATCLYYLKKSLF